jgi:N-acetylglucosaminyldiphosphoundecaprenol N-acetyl-beta-D-mannosaminyltransferase
VSTPNLNFAIAAQTDAAFRDSVVRSDLSIADGMPLVWVARLMGIPLRERVAGSTVFKELETTSDDTLATPLRVFFFGGPDGVAAQACEALNRAPTPAMTCVGFESPGFGSVEQMSTDDCLARINAAHADFVVVALGARKGQAWIEHNRHRLNAPVISHLGAVVNFVAGTVRRAPRGWQSVGMEWLWRIKEEPSLWRRYMHDGISFAGLMLSRVLPGAILSRLSRPSAPGLAAAEASLTSTSGQLTLTLKGDWSRDNIERLRPVLHDAAARDLPLLLDLQSLTSIDPAVIAQLSLLWAHCLNKGRRWSVTDVAQRVALTFAFNCASYLRRSVSSREDVLAHDPVAC